MSFEDLAKQGSLLPSRTSEEDVEAVLSGELSQVDLKYDDDVYLHRLIQNGELIKRIEDKGLRYFDTYADFLYVGRTSDNVIHMIRAMSAYHYGMCYGYELKDIAFFYLNAYEMDAEPAQEHYEYDVALWITATEGLAL